MKSKKSYINFPENNHILWLPPEAHSVTLNTAIKLYSEIVKGFEIKTFCRTIEEIKNVKLALEFANLAIKRLKEVKTQKKLLECILKNYNYEELKNHELFKDYEFSEYGSLINKNSKAEIFFDEHKPSPNSSTAIAKVINKFTAKVNIFRLAVVEKNISLMEEVANDILKSVPIVLNLLKTQEQLDLKYLNFISEILLFVKPEFQPEIIMQLADIRDLRILSSFSEILLNIKQYEKVITLLEPRILDINNDQEEESEVIYFCRYNLSLAYKGRGKLSLAEEQLLLILKNKPNDVDSIYSLVNVYIHNQKHEEAKNLIKNAPKDLKILMEMTLDLPSISESKLKDINLDNLPNNSKEQLLCFHFTAKYNSTPEKICNEENLKKELTEISKSIKDNPILLFTTALYTKQYKLAKQFRLEIPKEQITPYLDNIIQEIEFLLNPEEYIDQICIEALVSKLTFSQAQAIEAINKIITCLIAIEKYDLALNKVEEILQYDNKNHEAFENGLAAAKLANDLEKIKKYTDLLYQVSEGTSADTQEELMQYEDPKKIHEYYQSIKNAHLLHTIQQIIPSYSSWKIDKEGEVIRDATTPLGKYRGLKCYGKISKKLQKKLDSNQLYQFTKALEKGIIHKKEGQCGVKFCSNKVVEGKIKGDERCIHKYYMYKSTRGIINKF